MPCLETTAQNDDMAGTITAVDFQLGGCGVDAGVPPVDAGQPEVEPGVPDAGAVDAGIPDAGVTVDAGAPADAGVPDAGAEDAGPMAAADAGEVIVTPPVGCSCAVADGWGLLAFAVLASLRLLRRR